MKKHHIILVVIFVAVFILLVVGLGILIYFLHKKSHRGTIPEGWPADGDQIRLSTLIYSTGVPKNMTYSYYSLAAMSNDASDNDVITYTPKGTPVTKSVPCPDPYNSINISTKLNDPNAVFTTEYNTDYTLFALKTARGQYLSMNAPLDRDNGTSSNIVVPNNNYVSFGLVDSATDDTYFGIQMIEDNNVVLYSNKLSKDIGLLLIQASGNSHQPILYCYQGSRIYDSTKYGDLPVGMILGANPQNKQFLYMLSLKSPLSLPDPKYSFNDGNIINIKTTDGYLLYSSCQYQSAEFVGFTQNNQSDNNIKWQIKLSNDKKAFALLNLQSNAYLQPVVNTKSPATYVYTYTQLVTENNETSPYDQYDYTTWFILKNNKLVSLQLNMSFYMDETIKYQCSQSTINGAFGTSLSTGSDLQFVVVTK